MTTHSKKRVLSIQSHVVYGYVGNKSAVFPLQLLGFDVDFVNSVHFSNHTGYSGGLTGDILNGDQLRQILKGMMDNDLLDEIGHVLTGYIGSVSFLEAVLDVLKTARKYSKFRYVCDPVLGDEGRFYVPPELVEVYKTKLLPEADILTPNQFEVEQLTGISVSSIEDAREACKILHDMGPSIVFITSVVLEDDSTISILASRFSKQDGTTRMWRVDCPRIEGQFTGTGDLTAALLLAHTDGDMDDLHVAMEKVVNTMYVVIQRTQQMAENSVKSRELKLIQSKHDIENPPFTFKAREI